MMPRGQIPGISGIVTSTDTNNGAAVYSKRRCRKANRTLGSAGKLPGSVLTRYDSLGIYVRGRLQYAY